MTVRTEYTSFVLLLCAVSKEKGRRKWSEAPNGLNATKDHKFKTKGIITGTALLYYCVCSIPYHTKTKRERVSEKGEWKWKVVWVVLLLYYTQRTYTERWKASVWCRLLRGKDREGEGTVHVVLYNIYSTIYSEGTIQYIKVCWKLKVCFNVWCLLSVHDLICNWFDVTQGRRTEGEFFITLLRWADWKILKNKHAFTYSKIEF